MLCGSLDGRGVWGKMDTYICMAESLCCVSINITRLFRVPWTSRRSNQSNLKEINPEYSLEGLMLKLKLQYFGHMMQRSQLIGKDPDASKDWGQEKKGAPEDEMVGWHHQLNGHEFEPTLGDSGGQGSLACCCLWDGRVRHNLATEQQGNIHL